MARSYQYYKQAFEGQDMPFAYVDMDYFEQNIKDILQRAQDKQIRIASKSIRCASLMRYILDYNEKFQGVMCFTATEAVWLSTLGFDNLLVAYPTYNPRHIKAVAEAIRDKGKTIYLMTDRKEHLEQINRIGKQQEVCIPVCMDLDMSSYFPGIMYFGVYRSSINAMAKVKEYVRRLSDYPHLKLSGIMGYEAQIAGLGNNFKGQWLKNALIRLLQGRSVSEISARRTAVVDYVNKQVGELDFVNGGGTGSMEITRKEEGITEIAVGSGFYSPTLFDVYGKFRHKPAAGYAVEVVRQPADNVYTCLGGGYVASGVAGEDKIPTPYLPQGCSYHSNEMAGEVQTPLFYNGNEPIELGDPILFRHSKAGELCERFNELLLVRDGKVEETVPTYRGEGQCFL